MGNEQGEGRYRRMNISNAFMDGHQWTERFFIGVDMSEEEELGHKILRTLEDKSVNALLVTSEGVKPVKRNEEGELVELKRSEHAKR